MRKLQKWYAPQILRATITEQDADGCLRPRSRVPAGLRFAITIGGMPLALPASLFLSRKTERPSRARPDREHSSTSDSYRRPDFTTSVAAKPAQQASSWVG